jgi:hypothetical protein
VAGVGDNLVHAPRKEMINKYISEGSFWLSSYSWVPMWYSWESGLGYIREKLLRVPWENEWNMDRVGFIGKMSAYYKPRKQVINWNMV